MPSDLELDPDAQADDAPITREWLRERAATLAALLQTLPTEGVDACLRSGGASLLDGFQIPRPKMSRRKAWPREGRGGGGGGACRRDRGDV